MKSKGTKLLAISSLVLGLSLSPVAAEQASSGEPEGMIFEIRPMFSYPGGQYNTSLYTDDNIAGNTVWVPTGPGRIFINLFISNWGPACEGGQCNGRLNGWQADIRATAGAMSGVGANLTRALNSPIAPFSECSPVWGENDGHSDATGRCPNAWRSSPRSDGWGQLLNGLSSACKNNQWGVVSFDSPPYDFGYFATLEIGEPSVSCGINDPGVDVYGGTFALDVPIGAAGTYTIAIGSPLGIDTMFDDIPVSDPLPARITVGCDSSIEWSAWNTELLSESFNDVGTLVANNWVMLNRSQPLGPETWSQGDPDTFTAFSGAPDSYVAVGAGSASDGPGDDTVSDWLLLPPIEFLGGTVLKFQTRTFQGGTTPDRLEVRLSTSGASSAVGSTASSVGEFIYPLLSINPDLTVGGYPEDWTQYEVTLPVFSIPTTGRIAFRYTVSDASPGGANSNYIGIDDVSVTRLGAPGEDCNADGIPDVCNIERDGSVACVIGLGACCDSIDGTCFDGVTLEECNPAADPTGHTTWHIDRRCDQITCSADLGACCSTVPFGPGCVDNLTFAQCDPNESEKRSWHKGMMCNDIDCTRNGIPTTSEWGLVVLTLTMLVALKLYVARHGTETN